MNIENLTRNEVASCFGVDPSQITRWKAAGMPNKGKTFNLPACIQWRVAKSQADSKGKEGPDANKDQLDLYREEKTKIAKIQRLILKAKLISRKKIEAQLAARAFDLKANLMAMSRTASIKIAAKFGIEAKEVKRILDPYPRKFLEDYSRPIGIEEEKIV